jgi:hypothetical protein
MVVVCLLLDPIVTRYLPESKLVERVIKADIKVKAALDLIADQSKFDAVLARTTSTTSFDESRTIIITAALILKYEM